jgi:molecular chaperone GrpE
MSQAAENSGPGPGPTDTSTGPAPEPATAEQAARIAELEDLRLRALADLDNVRKRCAAQVSRAEAEARAAVTRQWLAVIDNLDLALEHAEADPGQHHRRRRPGGPGAGPGHSGPPGLRAP